MKKKILCAKINVMITDARSKNMNLVYTLYGKIYINLTNLCSNRCKFCIRNLKTDVEGKNLFLESEDVGIKDIIEQFKEITKSGIPDEVVFCGYGEPLVKFDLFIATSQKIKETFPNVKIRVNTNGHANLIHKRNVVPELSTAVNSVSVSLNAENKTKYNEISQPWDTENAYEAVKSFIKDCVSAKIDTTATVVDGYPGFEVNIEECKKIAESLGAKFRVREWLPAGY